MGEEYKKLSYDANNGRFKVINWESGEWTNSPEFCFKKADNLIVTAKEGSDFWEKTLYHFQHKNGHALLAGLKRSEAMEVTFKLKGFNVLYDQAGIMLLYDDTHWIKAGIEMIDGFPNISVVVTNVFSDCSNFPVPDWENKNITFRISPFEDAVLVRAKTEHSGWVSVRLARFPYTENIKAGPMVCSPKRSGFQVEFTRWIKTAPDKAQHENPPVL